MLHEDDPLENTRLRQRIAELEAALSAGKNGQPEQRVPVKSLEGRARTELVQPIDISLPVEEQVDLINAHAYLAECNQALAEIYGFSSPDTFLNTRLVDVHCGSNHPRNRAVLRRLVECGYQLSNVEISAVRSDGSPLWLLANIAGEIENGRLVRLWSASIDITAQMRAQRLLELSQKNLEMAQDNARLGSWEWWLEGDRVLWSKEMYTLFHVDPAAPLPSFLDYLQMIHPDDRPALVDQQQQVIKTNGPVTIEFRSNPQRGPLRYYQSTVFPVNEAGLPVHLAGTVQDITPLKQAYHQVLESEARYRLLTENITDVIWILDQNEGRFRYVSPSVFQLRGYTPEEVLTQSSEASITPESNQHLGQVFPARFQAYLEGVDKVYTDEITQPCKDGSIVITETSTRIVRNPENGHYEIYGVSRNIAERKRAEEELRQVESRYRALIENAPDGVVLFNENQRFIFASPSVERIFGYSSEEFIHLDPIANTHPEDHHLLRNTVANLISMPDQTCIIQYRFRHNNGEWRWIDCKFSNLLALPSVQAIVINFHDITDRRRAEQDLRASEENYRGLIESIDSAVATIDLSGKFLFMNDLAANQLCGQAKDYIGKTMSELFPPHVAESQLQNINWVFREDKSYTGENVSFIQGQPRWYRTCLQPLHDENGRVAQVLINTTDIHDLKMAQQELQELNQSLEERVRQRTAEVQDLYDHAPVGYHSVDEKGILIRVNQTQLDWLGYSREEMLGRPVTDFMSPESNQFFAVGFSIFTQTGLSRDTEFDFVRKDGTLMPLLIRATAVNDSQGRFVMSRTTAVDLTERKIVEKALRTSEETYRALFEGTNEAIFLIDPLDDRYVSVNPRAPGLLGYATREELIGQEVVTFVLPEQLADSRDRIKRLLAGEQIPPYERTFIRKDGKPVVTEIVLSLIRDANGQPKLVQSMVRDITQRKQAEEAMQQANLELERAVRMKDEFLASMSHELRTPLTGILGITESLNEQIYGPLTDKQRRAVNNIESSGKHLLELINDILDVAKLEAGKIELQKDTFSLAQVCQSSLQLIRGIAHKKDQKLSFSMQPADVLLFGDSRRIKQVVVNLLSNAVKYTPSTGSIGLLVEGDEHEHVVRITVWDTGIGIKPEDMARLFQPFVQIDSSLSRQQTGTGLGLTLVKSLVDLHGGSVQVESQFGKGSRFTATIPWIEDAGERENECVAGSAGPAAALAAHTPASAGMVMVVDDHEVNIQTMNDFLSSRGYQVVPVNNGWTFLEQVGQVRPRLVIMDIQMPGMDGLEAIRQLRAHAEPAVANTPVVAVTALAMTGDRERCLQAGANDYLSKPVRLRQLAEVIENLLAGA